MAVDFHERETLLPSQFLTDDDILSQNQINHSVSSTSEWLLNGFGSCGSSSSNLSTPVGSDLGSTETESEEEDDFIAELTRQMADYMLQEDDENTAPNCVSVNPKWFDCNLGSKHHHGQRPMSTPNVGFYSNQVLTDDQRRAIQLKNQQLIMKHQGSGSVCWGRRGKMTESTQKVEPKQPFQYQKQHHMENRGRACGFGNGGRVLLPQQEDGSGMRAIFLKGSGSKSGSCGTGVFLPRGTDINPLESRKKSGCSTALIPARVVQALKLHFDDMNAVSRSNGPNGYHLQHATSIPNVASAGRNEMYARRKGQSQSESQSQSQSRSRPAMNHYEMGLPHEWTY